MGMGHKGQWLSQRARTNRLTARGIQDQEDQPGGDIPNGDRNLVNDKGKAIGNMIMVITTRSTIRLVAAALSCFGKFGHFRQAGRTRCQ